MKVLNEINTSIFLEEIQKRVLIPEGQFQDFLQLWEFKKFNRNENILKSNEIPKFSIFVLKGCLRQYIVNEKGEESIVYFAEERHFIGDLSALRNKKNQYIIFKRLRHANCLQLVPKTGNKHLVNFNGGLMPT